MGSAVPIVRDLDTGGATGELNPGSRLDWDAWEGGWWKITPLPPPPPPPPPMPDAPMPDA